MSVTPQHLAMKRDTAMKAKDPASGCNSEFRKDVERAKKSFRGCLEPCKRTVNIGRYQSLRRHNKN